MIKRLNINADILGAVASGICLVHCIATPFLFVVHAGAHHHHHHHGSSPEWWGLIDIVFLLISLTAIVWSMRHTNKPWMKIALSASWLLLAAIIFNERLELIHLAEAWIYVPAIGLVLLHLYNRKGHLRSSKTKSTANL